MTTTHPHTSNGHAPSAAEYFAAQRGFDSPGAIAAAGTDKTQPVAVPVPLVRPLPPAVPYPVEALGTQLADVAGAIQEIVQSPPAMCANSVLAVATLAAQPHIDVELPIGSGAMRPVSSLFLTVGKSGERKSGTDDCAMRAVKEHEAGLRTTWEVDAKAHKLAHDAWEAERKSILGSGKSKKGNKIDRAGREADLRALGDEPLAPLAPIMTMAEPTIEGLAKLLITGQPSVGVFSAEGGQFVGGHAMSDDAKLRSAAALSHLWDGEPWKRVRSLDGAHTIANRRLAMHLMLQPDVAAQLVNDAVLRDQGLVSRLLVTFPTSVMGTRFYKEPSAGALALVAEFTTRIASALSVDMPLQPGTRNELAPRTIRLSPEARADWVRFSDHVERMLAPGGQLEPISGFAAKMAEHAARLAAVIAWWSDHAAVEIDAETLRGASRLVEHYGDEALRLWQASVVPPDIADAQRLLAWLQERWEGPVVSVADISQLGPNTVRVARRARELVGVLVEHGWLAAHQGAATIRGHRRREAWTIWGRAQP